MKKKAPLRAAIANYQQRDFAAEKKKKELKAGEKRKKLKEAKNDANQDEKDLFGKLESALSSGNHASKPTPPTQDKNHDVDDEEDFEDHSENDDDDSILEGGDSNALINGTIPQPILEPEASASEAEQDSDVSYSDLAHSDTEDIVPHQRMTINNGTALIASRKRVQVVKDPSYHTQPFHIHNSLISPSASAPSQISDPMDDETRELAFYSIARDAVLLARVQLKKEKIPFTRPPDYFAEMVKTDEHMQRIKKKLTDEATAKRASQEAKKLRDAKKFGKQVQVAREQERAREKRETLGKIQELKRKRKDAPTTSVTEGDDLFQEINIDRNTSNDPSDRATKRPRRDKDGRHGDTNHKRRAKDAKFGFGGKKRFSKSGDAESSADMRGFDQRRMKGRPAARGGGRGGGRGGKRLGKSRRVGGRN